MQSLGLGLGLEKKVLITSLTEYNRLRKLKPVYAAVKLAKSNTDTTTSNDEK